MQSNPRILSLLLLVLAVGCVSRLGSVRATTRSSLEYAHSERPSQTPPADLQGLPDGFTEQDAVKEAILRNPTIGRALADWGAAANVPSQVIWPSFPVAGYSPAIEPIETRLGPAQSSFGVQQAIPFPGKLYLRGKVASKEADVRLEVYHETINRIAEETSAAVFELAWVYEAVRITEETRDLLQDMEKVAREKFEVNAATQQDMLKAQVELSRVRNDLLALEDERQSAMARLISLLNRPPGSPIGRPSPVEVREAIPEVESLYDLAVEARPEIAAAKSAIGREETRLSLRKQEYLPDFNVGFQFVQIGDGPDAYSMNFGLTLPLWIPKIRASVREGEKRVESSEAHLNEVQNRTFFEVKDQHARWLTAARLVQLYEGTLIPQAEQSYRAAEAGYQSGQVDFLNYLDSQRTLLDFKLEYERAKVDAAKHLVALEKAVGRKF